MLNRIVNMSSTLKYTTIFSTEVRAPKLVSFFQQAIEHQAHPLLKVSRGKL